MLVMIRVSIKELKELIREQAEINEIFGNKSSGFAKLLDSILQDFSGITKKLEKAHELAPEGIAKAIVMGLHSDTFNDLSKVRKYVRQLKTM